MVTCVVIIAILSTRLLALFERNEAKQMSVRHSAHYRHHQQQQLYQAMIMATANLQKHVKSSHWAKYTDSIDQSRNHEHRHHNNLFTNSNGSWLLHHQFQVLLPETYQAVPTLGDPYESLYQSQTDMLESSQSLFQYNNKMLPPSRQYNLTTITTPSSMVTTSKLYVPLMLPTTLPNTMNNRAIDGYHTLFESEPVSTIELVFRLIGAFFCVLIILTTIIGNVLVIIVVTRFHRMRTVTNILLAR